jgi:hypothetical protein
VLSPKRSRAMPRRSPSTVAMIRTRESGESVQVTGTSPIRCPHRSASTSSSVSKNQERFPTSGSSTRAVSARSALNPHWASENPARSTARSSRL